MSCVFHIPCAEASYRPQWCASCSAERYTASTFDTAATAGRLKAIRALATKLKDIDSRMVGQGQVRQVAFERTALKLANSVLEDL